MAENKGPTPLDTLMTRWCKSTPEKDKKVIKIMQREFMEEVGFRFVGCDEGQTMQTLFYFVPEKKKDMEDVDEKAREGELMD